MNDLIQSLPRCYNKNVVVHDIQNVNFKPHPYCVGTRHVVFASDNFGGILGESAIEAAENAGIYCDTCRKAGQKLSYSEHKSDKVMFIKVSGEEDLEDVLGLKEYLFELKPICEANGIDGFAFIKGE